MHTDIAATLTVGHAHGTTKQPQTYVEVKQNDAEPVAPALDAGNRITRGAFPISGGGVLKVTGYHRIVDTQGRKNKKPIEKDIVPTLRAQSHGNIPMVLGRNNDGSETD